MKIKLLVSQAAVGLIMFLLFNGPEITAQPKQKDYYGMDYSKRMVFIPGSDSASPFYISKIPVTNKEYILYLVWTERVYGKTYPKVLYDALPGFDESVIKDEVLLPFSDSAAFRHYLSHSASYVSDYIFNPMYINSAVIGINWEQANKFCHWLSDRYNEYSLIKEKILMMDINQQNDNSFTSESFIFRQYEGLIDRPLVSFVNYQLGKGFDFVGYLMRPAFHLPTKVELQTAAKFYDLIVCLCAEPKGDEFLNPFYDFYLRNRRGLVYVDPDPYGENKTYYLASDFEYKTIESPEKISEWCLDSYLEGAEKSDIAVFRNYGYSQINLRDIPVDENKFFLFPRKDSLGFMEVIITGETNKKEFDLVKAPVGFGNAKKTGIPYIFDNKTGTVVNRNGDVFTCFRFAVNAIKK